MKTSLKKLKDCRVKLFVEVEADVVEHRFQEVLRSFQRAARLPGFREGKAPFDLIEKKFSEEAKEEVLKSLIPEAYHQSVRDQKVSPVTVPSIGDIQFERNKKLTFTAEFDRTPEVPVKNYKGIKLQRTSDEVSDADVEKAISSLLDSRATFSPVEEARAVREGDFVVVDLELWRDGAYAPGQKGVLLSVQVSEKDDFYEKVLGARIGEVRDVQLKPEAKPFAKAWVRAIKEKKRPALDDELARSFGKDTVEALRDAVRKDVASYKRSDSMEKMKKDLFAKLISSVVFVTPESLVQKQKERLVEQMRQQFARAGAGEAEASKEITAADTEIAQRAAEQVKLYFILQRIAEIESIEADELELEKRLQALAEQSKRPIDEVRNIFEEDLRDTLRESKTVDFLIANAKFEET